MLPSFDMLVLNFIYRCDVEQCRSSLVWLSDLVELGSVLLFVSDLGYGTESTRSGLQIMPNWGWGMVNMLEGRAVIERDTDKLEKWTARNLVKLSKEKCKILHLGWVKASCDWGILEERVVYVFQQGTLVMMEAGFVLTSGFGPHIQTKLVTNRRGEGGAAEMLRELAHMAYEERLKDLNFILFYFFFFCLGKPKGG